MHLAVSGGAALAITAPAREGPALKVLYCIRHCAASGQEPDAPLTPEGYRQAGVLAAHLAGAGIGRIISSPYRRAQESAAPLAARLGLAVETDPRLKERVLSAGNRPDWYERLRESFADPDLRLPGGESGREATQRGLAAIHAALTGPAGTVAVVTHGNLLALILHHFTGDFGFAGWQQLSTPDVYRLAIGPDNPQVQRVWDHHRPGPFSRA